MVSVEIAISILVVLVLLIGAAWFVALRHTRFKLTGLILAAVAAGFIYILMFSHVYVLDDEVDGRYTEHIALLASDFTFKNGEIAQIEPSFGFGKQNIIVNNNAENHVYGVRVYTSNATASRRPPSQRLKSYTVTYVNHSVDYIYREPPSSIRSKSSGDVFKGWIR